MTENRTAQGSLTNLKKLQMQYTFHFASYIQSYPVFYQIGWESKTLLNFYSQTGHNVEYWSENLSLLR